MRSSCCVRLPYYHTRRTHGESQVNTAYVTSDAQQSLQESILWTIWEFHDSEPPRVIKMQDSPNLTDLANPDTTNTDDSQDSVSKQNIDRRNDY